MRFTLGYTRTGTRIPWDSAGNPHIAVFGQSGSGKSFFLQGLIEQAAEQGAACIVLDYSQDYGQFAPRKGICFRQVDVSSPEFSINPLALSSGNELLAAQRLLSAIHSVFHLGTRGSSSLQRATVQYLREAEDPTIGDLLTNLRSLKGSNVFHALEPLEALGSMVHLGTQPLSLDLERSGITVLTFSQFADPQLRSFLVELVLSTIWNLRAIHPGFSSVPLILLLDECQNLRWSDDGCAIRLLREGRKFGIAGWFSTQFVDDKRARAALAQAALQANFRPDALHAPGVAKELSQWGRWSRADYLRELKSMKTGQFYLCQQSRDPIVVQVPKRG